MQKVSFASIDFKKGLEVEYLSDLFAKYLWVITYVSVISIAGGVTSYIRKKKAGLIERFSLKEFFGDMLISFFVGVMTYLLCTGIGLNELLTAGVTGITSHMGTKALMLSDGIIPKVICKYLKIDCK